MEARLERSTFGRLRSALLVGSIVLTTIGCGASPDRAASNSAEPAAAIASNLHQFALASCLLAYFEQQGWDTRSIRGIAGGYVEKGSSDPEVYAQIAEFVRAWRPAISTKHELDVELVKCFELPESTELTALVQRALKP